jgi:hypothetical protein
MASKTDAAAKQAVVQKNIDDTIAKYAYFNWMIEQHPELSSFFDTIKSIVRSSPTGQISDNEFYQATRGVAFFENLDSAHQRSEIQQAEDKQNNTNLYGDKLASVTRNLQSSAAKAGLSLSPDTVAALAKTATESGWDAVQTQDALGQEIQKAAAAGQDLRGTAGDYQTQLAQWAQKNGIDLTPEQAAPFIARGALGQQGLEDAKQEIRKSYLRGMYPAWSDSIDKGMDPSDVFAPYQQTARKLLEDDSISLNDPIMQKITQYVDANGKAAVLPLYDAQRMIREDPRWQRTDNAYATYTTVADNLLKTFGFR